MLLTTFNNTADPFYFPGILIDHGIMNELQVLDE